MLHTRRTFLFASLAIAGGRAALGRNSPTSDDTALRRGRRFLISLVDPELDLLPEFRGSHTYWLYHDNYLAARVLEADRPDLSRSIMAAIRRWGVERSGKIEILFEPAQAPPFFHHELVEVGRVGDKLLKTERLTDRENTGWRDYADLRFLAAISLARRDRDEGRAQLRAGLAMWDGLGFADRVQQLQHQYATYKLALALIASHRLDHRASQLATIRERLAGMQNDEGGWITDYDADLTPRGLANVETTCLALIALTC